MYIVFKPNTQKCKSQIDNVVLSLLSICTLLQKIN